MPVEEHDIFRVDELRAERFRHYYGGEIFAARGGKIDAPLFYYALFGRVEDGADIERFARAYAALQADLTEDKAGRKDLGDLLLERLAGALAG